jgi:hypothetical protein
MAEDDDIAELEKLNVTLDDEEYAPQIPDEVFHILSGAFPSLPSLFYYLGHSLMLPDCVFDSIVLNLRSR